MVKEGRGGVRRYFAVIALLSALLIVVVSYIATPFPSSSTEPGAFTTYYRGTETAEGLAGRITIDGSSTVYLITEAVVEAFMEEFPDVSITIGVSGTGGGFKRFVEGEIDINDASRRIKQVEIESAKRRGIRWIEIPIAIDGLSVVINRENYWVDCLTLEELKEMWKGGSGVEKWSDVRKGWPDVNIRLYGPGPDSGTFDFFTERVMGEVGHSRTDYIASEDDNVLAAGISADKYALGYFGYAYYVENKDKLRAVPIDGGEGCVEPVDENIINFKYPLTRPLFIYVNEEYFNEKKHLREFVYFYLENAELIVKEVGYVPLPEEYYEEMLELLRAGRYEDLQWILSYTVNG